MGVEDVRNNRWRHAVQCNRPRVVVVMYIVDLICWICLYTALVLMLLPILIHTWVAGKFGISDKVLDGVAYVGCTLCVVAQVGVGICEIGYGVHV